MTREAAAIEELWQEPLDLASRDLLSGPGGADMAPEQDATYAFVGPKTTGKNPGYDVRSPDGRLWSVKLGEEAQPEARRSGKRSSRQPSSFSTSATCRARKTISRASSVSPSSRAWTTSVSSSPTAASTALVRTVTADDVRWACERLSRLSDGQWHDAFRAAHYSDDAIERYVRKIKQKIAQGLEVAPQ